jgi:hypothetical protein
MPRQYHRYRFRGDIPIAEISDSLILAFFAAEGLHGSEAAWQFVTTHRRGVIDVSTPFGRDLESIFQAFVRRQFGDGVFQIQEIQIGEYAMPGKEAA